MMVSKEIQIMIYLASAIWIIHLINFTTGYSLNEYLGLIPRETRGLLGIAFAPFLHGGFIHIISNTIPLIILGSLMGYSAKKDFIDVNLIILVLGGILVWIFARGSIHVGASGVVMGYFGYLMSISYFEKSIKNAMISLIVFVFYGGMIFSILPSIASYISWEGHLFGFISGVIAAYYISKKSD